MKPLGDRVLILVEEVADVTMGGVILPESAKERPLIGTVVRTGPGKYDKDVEGSKRKAMTVSRRAGLRATSAEWLIMQSERLLHSESSCKPEAHMWSSWR